MNILIGAVITLIALWGGSWLFDFVTGTYKVAAMVTSAVILIIGVAWLLGSLSEWARK